MNFAHFCASSEYWDASPVSPTAPAICAPELDVVGVVMRLEEPAAMIGIPCGDAVVERLLRERIHPLQPCRVARDLPVAVDLHDAAELPIGCSWTGVIDGSVWNRSPEVHVAAFVHRARQLELAKCPLGCGEEM